MKCEKHSRVHYSWVMVVITSLILFAESAQTMSAGVFMTPVVNTFGCSFTAGAFAFSMTQVMLALTSPLFASLFQKYKVKKVVLFAMILQAVSLILFAAGTNLFMIGVSCAIQGTAMAGIYNVLPSVVVERWFGKNGKTALNIIMICSMSGGLVFTPIVSTVIMAKGWRIAAMMILAFVVIVAIPLALIFVKESPESMGLSPYIGDNPEAGEAAISRKYADLKIDKIWKTPAFYVVILYMLGVQYCFAFSNHIVNYAKGVGFGEVLGMTAVSVGLAAGLVARILLGAASTKWGQDKTTVFCSGIGIICMIIMGWMYKDLNDMGFLILAFFLGFYLRTGTIQQLSMVYNVFGASGDYTKISARALMISGIVCITGNTIMGGAYELTGNYQLVFILLIALAAIAIITSRMLYKDMEK